MKRRYLVVCIVAALVAAILIAAGLKSVASANTINVIPRGSTSVSPEKGPGPRGVQTTGYLKSEAKAGWCLTEPSSAEDGDVVFMAECATKGEEHAHQIWHCAMIKGLGECSPIVGNEPLNLGQRGKTAWALSINPNKNGSLNYILHFIKVTGYNAYVLQNNGYHGDKLAIPLIMRRSYVYPLEWRNNEAKNVSFVFTTPPWKEDPTISTAAVVTPAKPGPRGVYGFGQIKSATHPGWCVTAPREAADRVNLFLAQCAKKPVVDAWQMWHLTMFRGIGEISLSTGNEPLDVGQYGNTANVKVINPDKAGNYNYILGYSPVAGGRWVVKNQGYHGYYLAMPTTPFIPNHVPPIHWMRASVRGQLYTLILPEWKEDPSVNANMFDIAA